MAFPATPLTNQWSDNEDLTAADMNARIDQMLNLLQGALPVLGHTADTTDANGDFVVVHGLGFTPSYVFAQSRINTFGASATQVTSTSAYTSTTFTVRLLSAVGVGGGQFQLTQLARPFDIRWIAYR